MPDYLCQLIQNKYLHCFSAQYKSDNSYNND